MDIPGVRERSGGGWNLDTVVDIPSTELQSLRELRDAVKEYFYFSDIATAHGKTREEFMRACDLSHYARNKMREVLESV